MFLLHQTLGLVDDHLRHLHMPGGGLVEGGRDHLATHVALHVRHFLGALVDQKDNEDNLRVILGHRVGDVLQQDGLARLGRGDNQTALTEPDGVEEVDDAGGHLRAVVLQHQLPGRVEGGQVVEENPLPGLGAGRVDEVDPVHLLQGEEALAFPRLPNGAGDGVAGPQREAAHLARAHVDVVRAGLVVAVRAAQKAETIRQELQDAFGMDLELLVGDAGEERKRELLLLQPLGALDAGVVGHLRQLGNLHPLQVIEAEHLHRRAVRAEHDGWGGPFVAVSRLEGGQGSGHLRVGSVQVIIADRPADGSEHRAQGGSVVGYRRLSLRVSVGAPGFLVLAASTPAAWTHLDGGFRHLVDVCGFLFADAGFGHDRRSPEGANPMRRE